MFNILGSYRDTIIGNLGKPYTEDLLLHILLCWHSCAVDEENRDLLKFITVQECGINIIHILVFSDQTQRGSKRY